MTTQRLVFLLLFSSLILPPSSLLADTLHGIVWEVECSRPAPYTLDLIRGETVTLAPRFLDHGIPLTLSNTYETVLQYRDSTLATDLYYAVTGSVSSATQGYVSIPWTPACEAAASTYTYTIAARSVAGQNLSGFGTIKLRGSVGGTATNMPRTFSTLDCATVQWLNPGAAPFATSTTAYASFGTIQGNASDSASLVAHTANATNALRAWAEQRVVDVTQNVSTVESDPLSLHTQSVVLAWSPTGGTFTNTQIIASSPLLTNGYASAAYTATGSLTIAITMSSDSNIWSAASTTNGPVYLRLTATALVPGGSAITISNIAIYSWLHPALWRTRPDLMGQIVLTDTPTEARQIANKTYVDTTIAANPPASWASYPAISDVVLDNHPLMFGSGFQIYSHSGYSAWSYAPVTVAAGTDEVWRLQFGGEDIMRVQPSYTLLAITNFAVDVSNHFEASVWTGGVIATPYIQYTTNLLAPSWSIVSLDTNSYPTELEPGSYYLRWTNTFPSPSYFRAACGDPTSNRVIFLWPVHADQPGGNVVTNGQTVPSATVSATSTNALNLGGIAADRYPTNLAAGVIDPCLTGSNITTYTTGTVTVSRAWGDSVSIAATNNLTLCFDVASYPSNAASFVALSYHPNGFSTTFCPSSISTNAATGNPPGSAGVTLKTNAWNLLIFAKSYGITNLMGVRQ